MSNFDERDASEYTAFVWKLLTCFVLNIAPSPLHGVVMATARPNETAYSKTSSIEYCTIETLWPSLRRFSARGIIDFTWLGLAPAMAGMNKMLFAVAVLIIGNEIANTAVMSVTPVVGTAELRTPALWYGAESSPMTAKALRCFLRLYMSAAPPQPLIPIQQLFL
ncbi:hypothetical protein M514_26074 [Trichuris suis]|uniref:Uncharacterized protein n=1 Tax=Trichuris suis TaxID=68888 RepID=A0A085MWY5_9BILA|nr:hypothetical protein M514_26074 [Trichuris suis]